MPLALSFAGSNCKFPSFNLLRVCDFIFAYKLIEYEKICIVESDLVIMNNIDSIFNLNSPSIRFYRTDYINFNKNLIQRNNKEKILSKKNRMKCNIISKNDLKKKGFGGIIAVGQGSRNEPKLIILPLPFWII